MSKRWIQVGEEVFAEMQKRAEPLVDDADSVLRRVLGIDSEQNSSAATDDNPSADVGGGATLQVDGLEAIARSRPKEVATTGTGAPNRAPKGSLLPEADYEVPLLEAIVELGGAAPTSRVLELLELKLNGKLTETDRKNLKTGRVRWKNRVQFVRLALIRDGYMAKDAPRGIWEITDEGRAHVEIARRSQ